MASATVLEMNPVPMIAQRSFSAIGCEARQGYRCGFRPSPTFLRHRKHERNNVLLVLHMNVRNDADITAAWSQR